MNQTNENLIPTVEFIAQTKLPSSRGDLTVRAYRNAHDGSEPLALFYMDPTGGTNVPLRVHDACMTSEIFGSLKCDCKNQLDYALDYIFNHGGMVIYLPQEGRGIGLANKIAAYALQEKGLDTIEANEALHLPVDAREYGSAAEIITEMKISSIQLLTNNPRKISKLQESNITITKRLEILISPNQHSLKYLQTKHLQMGHLLDKLDT